ncbi:GntR family transcriptional regulator/MocR family aminotransferase [Pedobacter sp. CAN_A7]|uniref:aminotransferase-like domain-containing protein n=1 Tax=Pedobacter sp. CAN_A7 TaxID=2787722 RepID=UPI0018CB890E
MSSPVRIPFKNLIQIDRKSDRAVYLQLAYQLIIAIQRGLLAPGIQLPGSRQLSALLDLHRKTIIAAYDELDAQGWIEVRPNKGTFVCTKFQPIHTDSSKHHQKLIAGYPAWTGYNFKKSILLDLSVVKTSAELEFTDGLPDVRLAPLADLSRVYGTNLKRKSNLKHLGFTPNEGSEYFKELLTTYLNNTRGLHISKNNVMVTRGVDMGIYLAAELLLQRGDLVLVADLSYYVANMIFQKVGAKIVSAPVDEQGINVHAVEELCKLYTIRMLYLTPHQHYPTTVTLSAQRRAALLQLSSIYGFIILEDDYDYDFQFDSNPILPLASADTQGMVIYIGSFAKSLAPGFRCGYLVAPENLIKELGKLRGLIDRQGDLLMEQTLAELLEEGQIQRHLKKTLKVYMERRNAFCTLLQTHLDEFVSFDVPAGGLAVWTKWKAELNLMRISNNCMRNQLYLPQTLLYQKRGLTAMRLGFGNQTVEELERSVKILAAAIKKST